MWRGRVSNNGNITQLEIISQRQIALVTTENQRAEARPRLTTFIPSKMLLGSFSSIVIIAILLAVSNFCTLQLTPPSSDLYRSVSTPTFIILEFRSEEHTSELQSQS